MEERERKGMEEREKRKRRKRNLVWIKVKKYENGRHKNSDGKCIAENKRGGGKSRRRRRKGSA